MNWRVKRHDYIQKPREFLRIFVFSVGRNNDISSSSPDRQRIYQISCSMGKEKIGKEKVKNMNTGLFDKNGNPIKIGDKTKLVLDNGEVREFDVCFKTVTRTVKCHPDFDDEYSKVAITGVVFCWNGYDLFPCVDENGVMDTSKMEVINKC